MGIRNLYKFLKESHPECFTPVHMTRFAFKKIGIDMMQVLYIYKSKFPQDWLRYVIFFLLNLRKKFIHPVCFFDGRQNPLKKETVDKRYQDREKGKKRVEMWKESLGYYHKTQNVTDDLRELMSRVSGGVSIISGAPNIALLTEYIQRQDAQYSSGFCASEILNTQHIVRALGIPVFEALHDAEDLAAQLCAKGLLDTVMTNDSDVLVFGCPSVLIQFSKDSAIEVSYEQILTCLGMTPSQFRDFCILCGTDFNAPVKGIGIKTAFKLLMEYGSLENIPQLTASDLESLKLKELRSMFCVSCPPMEIRYCEEPDMNALSAIFFRLHVPIQLRALQIPASDIIFTSDK